MTKRNASKFIGASALALSLAVCGYGTDRGAGFSARAAFKPMVARGVDSAMGVNLDKDQAFKVVDAFADCVFKVLKSDPNYSEKDMAEAKKKIAAIKADPFSEAPKDVRKFLEKSGLRDAEFHWAVLSLENFEIVGDMPRLDGLSLAVAGTVDLERLVSAIRQEKDCDVLFAKTQIEGETAWHIVPEKEKNRKELAELHVDPYIMSLDGRLALVALSREALVKQIRLYRTGSGKGDALCGFSAATGELAHLHFSDIGGRVRKYVPRRELGVLNKVIPNGDELVLGLGDLNIALNVLPDGMMSDSLRLGTASDTDADNLRTLAKTGLMVLNARLANDPDVADFVKKIVGAVKVGGTGRTFEVQGGSFAVVAGAALFPAISSAMLGANLNSMSMQGRKLIMGILQANIEREAAGKGSVWSRTHTSATDYFNALFDMQHYGTAEWEPCVDGELLRTLWGAGVSGMNGQKLTSANVAWTVAANVTDETPDFMPVLITANFNPSLLLSKWDGKTNGSKKLSIGRASGAEKSMFGDKGIVVIRKSGAVESFKAGRLTYDALYKKQAFDLTNMKPPLMYLTPSGVVEPVGHK